MDNSSYMDLCLSFTNILWFPTSGALALPLDNVKGRCFAIHLLKQSDSTNQTVKVPRDGCDRKETLTPHPTPPCPVPPEPSASPPHPQTFSISSCDSGHQLGTEPLITALSTTTALVKYL